MGAPSFGGTVQFVAVTWMRPPSDFVWGFLWSLYSGSLFVAVLGGMLSGVYQQSSSSSRA